MTAPGQSPPDPVTAEADRALRALARLGGDLIGHANRLAPIVWSAPRIVIVGRLKAGKSTLVNALVGERIAETGALEVTKLLSVFHYGQPARAEVRLTDGRVLSAPLVDGVLGDLPVAPDAIARVDRYLPSSSIRDMTLIDTPGLATLTGENEERARKALLPGYSQTEDASVGADAAIFVFESLPRAYERDFVNQLGFTPLNTVGVLARADSFGEGAMGSHDPVDAATEYAGVLSERMRTIVSTVLPSCGLLAQAAFTGQITEHVAADLARYADLNRRDLFMELESVQPELLAPQTRDRLIDIMGEYGVITSAHHARRGAAAVNQWLTERSGLLQLDRYLRTQVVPFAALQRTIRLEHELHSLAAVHPAGQHIRHIARVMMEQPAMVKVNLFRAYNNLLTVGTPSRLSPIVRRALEASSPAQLLGLAEDASDADISTATRELYAQLQQMALIGTSAAEDAARGALSRYMSARGMNA